METSTDSKAARSAEKGASPIPLRPGLFEDPSAGDGSPALLGNRCRTCGRVFFPKRTLCPQCFIRGDLEPARLNRRGTIFSSTLVHISSPTGIKAPYAYGYVDLDQDNLRVFALFSGPDPAVFKPGVRVELVIEEIQTDAKGPKMIGYKFKPADEGSTND